MARYTLSPSPDENPFAIDFDLERRLEQEEQERKERLKRLFEKPNTLDGAVEFGAALTGLPLPDGAGLPSMRPNDPALSAAALATADREQVKKLMGENPSSLCKDLVASAALHDRNSDEPYFGLSGSGVNGDQAVRLQTPAPFDADALPWHVPNDDRIPQIGEPETILPSRPLWKP